MAREYTPGFDEQVVGTCSVCLAEGKEGKLVQSKFWVADKIDTHCVRCGAKPVSIPVVNCVRPAGVRT